MARGINQASPLYFLSYARSRWANESSEPGADYWIRRFQHDLAAAVTEFTGTPDDTRPATEQDADAAIQRHDELLKRLARCAVFVPLYSSAYFTRPDCGREWSVIRLRQDMQISATGRARSMIVPVLWKPVRPADMPPWVRNIQYTHESLGPDYHTMGLESLLRLRQFRDTYKAVVTALATRIVEVSRSGDQLCPLIDIPPFEALPDAFAGEGDPTGNVISIRITVAALDKHSTMGPGRSTVWYGETPEEWCPYRDESRSHGGAIPAAWRAAAVAERREFTPQVGVLSHRSEVLKPLATVTAPTLVLIDAWTTLDEHWSSLLSRLDRAVQGKPWVRMILPWNTRDPETVAHGAVLRAGIMRTIGRSLTTDRGLGPADSAAFGAAVGEAMRLIQTEFLKNARKHLPPGPRPAKPRLRGPGGEAAFRGGDR